MLAEECSKTECTVLIVDAQTAAGATGGRRVRLVIYTYALEMLAHSHYESMFSSTALVYRISHMCRFECNVRMCADELLRKDSPLDIQVAHSLVWLSLVDLSGS